MGTADAKPGRGEKAQDISTATGHTWLEHWMQCRRWQKGTCRGDWGQQEGAGPSPVERHEVVMLHHHVHLLEKVPLLSVWGVESRDRDTMVGAWMCPESRWWRLCRAGSMSQGRMQRIQSSFMKIKSRVVLKMARVNTNARWCYWMKRGNVRHSRLTG